MTDSESIYQLPLAGLMDLSDDEQKPESVTWAEWWRDRMEQNA